MIKYNVIYIDNKVASSYLNLTQQEFYDVLWDYTFEWDLWDYIEECSELLKNEEELKNWLYNSFIPEWMFHRYEDDEIDCFAFISDLENSEYKIEEELVDFLIDKIHSYVANR